MTESQHYQLQEGEATSIVLDSEENRANAHIMMDQLLQQDKHLRETVAAASSTDSSAGPYRTKFYSRGDPSKHALDHVDSQTTASSAEATTSTVGDILAYACCSSILR